MDSKPQPQSDKQVNDKPAGDKLAGDKGMDSRLSKAAQRLEEEEEVPKAERDAKPIHLLVVVPNDKEKELVKIKQEILEIVKDSKPRLWIHLKTPQDIWNYGLDSKFDFIEAVSMVLPLHDKGILGSLRVANIHKSLVLRKFDKYVVSYVVGGSLVRGEAKETSDVDTYIVIDDTDVKRTSRLELKERLRGIIYGYAAEASELAGVKGKLNIQVYILTEFWEAVKDAHPVIFTFIRDGIPMYDRGAFLPWKLLLRMGKIKPSPEAIDMFMSMGEKVSEIVKRRLLDIVIGDIYWGVVTPSQALLMLYGLPPPNVRETVTEMKRVFYEKEKMLEKKYIDILTNIVDLYKGFEHGKVNSIKGVEVDRYLKESEDYIKRLKELRGQIEKRTQEKTINQIHDDVFNLLKAVFGSQSQDKLVKSFENNLIKRGLMPPKTLHILNDIIEAKANFKKGKLATHEVEHARKDASLLINHLIEYTQRKDLVPLEKGKIKLKVKDKELDMLITSNAAFLFTEQGIFKITDKLTNAAQEDLEIALKNQQGNIDIKINPAIFDTLKKEFGDFEIIL
ncbi:nucleotidyltransferase domain-containing protein [Candidatus Pacearchaeota archaeon]|nr:nucleotidyltransferase domain-containing protein [Candidatus Pacearchaeota archaeon]